MSSELVAISTKQGIKDLSAYLDTFDFIAYDCETTGLDKSSEVIGVSVCSEETKAFYVILQEWDSINNQLVSLDLNDELHALLLKLKTKSLIMHNGIFDCMIAENYFKISLIDSLHTDSMVLAHLLNENRRIGLKDLGKEYFGDSATNEMAEMKESITKNGGSVTKDSYELYKADSELIAKYGAQDALLTFKLFNELVPELYEQKLDKFFYEDESMPLLRGPTYQLNTIGLKVDLQYLGQLKKQLEAECLEARAFIASEIASKVAFKYPGNNKKTTFNINSNQQLGWLLFGVYGLEFGTLTKAGKSLCRQIGIKPPYTLQAKRDFIRMCLDKVGHFYQPEAIVNGKKVKAKAIREPWSYIAADKKTLAKYASKIKWVEKLLELKKKSKILDTYVLGIEERTRYGIIQPSFLQTGTPSGRYSSRSPNFQNLPRDDKRVKQSIVARPGKVFVGADYSQLEPRVFAYYSKDKRLAAAFDGTTDFYSVIGMEVYGKTDCTPQKEGSLDAFGVKYKKLRDFSKVIALASTYGATAWQLMQTTGKSEKDTQQDIDNYFESFPGVKDMMLEAHKIAKDTGQVVNLFGRPRRMPDAKNIQKLYGNQEHGELPYEARNVLNLACNFRIQSTGASIVNRAAIAFHATCKQLSIQANLVCQIHDELIVECNETDAESVSLILRHCMEETTKLQGVPLEAIPRITKTLAK